jgi:hypothetical protein
MLAEVYAMQIAMHIAKRCPPSVLAIRTAEAHGAVWVMIAILLGLISFTLVGLLVKVGG